MNCVHEYFGAYSMNVVFLKSRIRTELQEPGFSASGMQQVRQCPGKRLCMSRHRTWRQASFPCAGPFTVPSLHSLSNFPPRKGLEMLVQLYARYPIFVPHAR